MSKLSKNLSVIHIICFILIVGFIFTCYGDLLYYYRARSYTPPTSETELYPFTIDSLPFMIYGVLQIVLLFLNKILCRIVSCITAFTALFALAKEIFSHIIHNLLIPITHITINPGTDPEDLLNTFYGVTTLGYIALIMALAIFILQIVLLFRAKKQKQ